MSNRSPSLRRSDEVSLYGKLKAGFGEYDASIYFPKIYSVTKAIPPDYAGELRASFSESFRRALNDDAKSNLALAYLVGEKGRMSEEFSEALRNVGLSHIVVASGFHLGVLLSFIKKLLRKRSRILCLIASFGSILIFVAIAGFSPSLARAGIISAMSLLAWYCGRRFHPARSLLFAALISLAINPDYLISLAWQLSFAAYAGITILAPIATSYLYGAKKPNFFASSIIQSVSAQLLCLPLVIYTFGKLPLLGVFANMLISPSIAAVMFMSLLYGLWVSLISSSGLIAFILSLPLRALLAFHISTIEGINSIPWVSLELEAGNPLIFLTYLPSIFVVLYMRWRSGFSFRPRPQLENTQKYGKIYTC